MSSLSLKFVNNAHACKQSFSKIFNSLLDWEELCQKSLFVSPDREVLLGGWVDTLHAKYGIHWSVFKKKSSIRILVCNFRMCKLHTCRNCHVTIPINKWSWYDEMVQHWILKMVSSRLFSVIYAINRKYFSFQGIEHDQKKSNCPSHW